MEAFEVLPNQRVVLFKERPPSAITEFDGFAGRVHDVSEHYGGKHSIRFRSAAHASEEFFDLVDKHVRVAGPRYVIVAECLDVFRRRDMLCEIPSVFNLDSTISRPVKNERGNCDRGQDLPGIDVIIHPKERLGRGRTRALSFEHRAPRLISFVLRETRGHRHPQRPRTPRIAYGGHASFELVSRATPWIIRRPGKSGEAFHEHESRGTPRIRRSEQRAHGPALRYAENRSAFRADGIHHATNVVHSLF